MNHPPREDWVPYLFGEANSETRRQLRQHLDNCPDCRAELNQWRRTLGRLDAWKLSPPPRTREGGMPVLRWALAATAVVMLALGILVGRLTSPAIDPEQVRAAIEPQLRQELRADLARMLRDEVGQAAEATLAASGRQTRDWLSQYARAIEARLETERSERIADCLSLKKDVDTLAVNADASLRRTQQGLALLAHSPEIPPANNPVHN